MPFFPPRHRRRHSSRASYRTQKARRPTAQFAQVWPLTVMLNRRRQQGTRGAARRQRAGATKRKVHGMKVAGLGTVASAAGLEFRSGHRPAKAVTDSAPWWRDQFLAVPAKLVAERRKWRQEGSVRITAPSWQRSALRVAGPRCEAWHTARVRSGATLPAFFTCAKKMFIIRSRTPILSGLAPTG